MNFRTAAKAFIVQDKKVLLLKRRPNDSHKPEEWDIPGGRVEEDENPYTAVEREAEEEAHITIDVIAPIEVQHFTRDDGQRIAMTIFLCSTKDTTITLSEEHTEYRWQSIEDIDAFPEWLHSSIQCIQQHKLLDLITE